MDLGRCEGFVLVIFVVGCASCLMLHFTQLFKEELLSGGTPQHHRAELLQILGHDIKPQILSEVLCVLFVIVQDILSKP